MGEEGDGARRGGKIIRLRHRQTEPSQPGKNFDGCAPDLCVGWKPFLLFLAGGCAVFLFLYFGVGEDPDRLCEAIGPATLDLLALILLSAHSPA